MKRLDKGVGPVAGLLAVTALMLPLLAGSALEAADELPAVTHDGLHLVPGTEVAAAYVKPGADFGVYDRILLVDAYVAFKKGWMQQQNQSSLYRVTNRDVENIKEAMAELFREVFEEELAGGNGYPVVDVPDTDVLLLRPAIIDLDVTAPDLDRGTRSYNFAASAGAATLYLELYDSVSGEILARVLDRQEARSAGDFMRWTNEMTNRAAAREVLAGWASLLRDRLDEIHARAGEENGGESTPEE